MKRVSMKNNDVSPRPRLRISAAMVAVLLLPTSVFAAAMAFDSAASPAYDDGWASNDNGGSGFLPWSSVTPPGANSGTELAVNSEVDVKTPLSSGRAWGIYANDGIVDTPSGYASALRRFDGILDVGQTFHIDFDNGAPAAGDSGIFFMNPSGSRQVGLYATASSNYNLWFGNSAAATTIPRTSSGVHIALTLPTADSYSMAVTPLAGGPTTTLTGLLEKAGGIDRAHFSHYRTGLPDDQRTYFNNMEILDPGVIFRETFSSVETFGAAVAGSPVPVDYAGTSFTLLNTSGGTATATTTVDGQLHIHDTAVTSADRGNQYFTTVLENLGNHAIIEGDIGMDNGNGGSSAGIRIGNRAFLFFPGYVDGAFRIYGINPDGSRSYILGNTDMGFGPANSVLHHMAIDVSRTANPGEWLYDVTIEDHDSDATFNYQHIATTADFDPIGPMKVGFFGGEYGERTNGAVYTRRYDNLTVTVLIPEPATAGLLALGGLSLLCLARRRRRVIS